MRRGRVDHLLSSRLLPPGIIFARFSLNRSLNPAAGPGSSCFCSLLADGSRPRPPAVR